MVIDYSMLLVPDSANTHGHLKCSGRCGGYAAQWRATPRAACQHTLAQSLVSRILLQCFLIQADKRRPGHAEEH